jgi:hypothetical protein
MRKEVYLTKLIGSLTKFSRDQRDWSPGDIPYAESDDFSIMLNDSLTPQMKAIIYEIQVEILLGMTYKGRTAPIKNLCQKAMEIYEDNHCPLRRIRVAERLLYLAVLEGDISPEPIDIGAQAIRNLTAMKVRDVVSR